MLLVECGAAEAKSLRSALPDWKIVAEKRLPRDRVSLVPAASQRRLIGWQAAAAPLVLRGQHILSNRTARRFAAYIASSAR